MKNILNDNLIVGVTFSFLALITTLFLGLSLIPTVCGVSGFMACKRSLEDNQTKTNSKRRTFAYIGMLVGILPPLLAILSYLRG